MSVNEAKVDLQNRSSAVARDCDSASNFHSPGPGATDHHADSDQIDPDELLSGRYTLRLPNHEDEYPPSDAGANAIEVAPDYDSTGFYSFFSIGGLETISLVENQRPRPGSGAVKLSGFGMINTKAEFDPNCPELFISSEHEIEVLSDPTIEFTSAGTIKGQIRWKAPLSSTRLKLVQFEGVRVEELEDGDMWKALDGQKDESAVTADTSLASNSDDSDNNTSQDRVGIAAMPWYRRMYLWEENLQYVPEDPIASVAIDISDYVEEIAAMSCLMMMPISSTMATTRTTSRDREQLVKEVGAFCEKDFAD